MQPTDLNLHGVLGAASGKPIPLAELSDLTHLSVPDDGQPTADVIATAVGRALADALIVMIDDARHPSPAMDTTLIGDHHVKVLLRKAIARGSGGFMRACMRATRSFLRLLPQPDRRAGAALLRVLYHEGLACVRRLQTLADRAARPTFDELRRERLRLGSELAWLEAMTARPQVSRATE